MSAFTPEEAAIRAEFSEEALKLHDKLRPIQEKKGYHFNKDLRTTLELMEELLTMRKRYSYMACPCRLASSNAQADKDIICPCAYRDADLKEYGSCFCGLYVTQDWNDEKIPHVYVPDRRPPEKILI